MDIKLNGLEETIETIASAINWRQSKENEYDDRLYKKAASLTATPPKTEPYFVEYKKRTKKLIEAQCNLADAKKLLETHNAL